VSTRRVLSARRAAADALAWLPYAAPPAAALRELVEAIAIDYCDGDRADALLTLVDERDAQFSDLLMLACGVNLSSVADHEPGARQALVDHIARMGTAFAIGDPDVPVALARLVTLTAAAHHAGDRRAAFRELANDCDAAFCALFAAITGLEL
jgi:hypothetical protein